MASPTPIDMPIAGLSADQATAPATTGSCGSTNQQLSVPVFISSIIATATGTCLLTVLGLYLITHRHKFLTKYRRQKEAEALLEREAMSRAAEGLGLNIPPPAELPQESGKKAMTPAVSVHRALRPPVPAKDRRGVLRKAERPLPPTPHTSRSPSTFTDNTDQVYANILGRPIEPAMTRNVPERRPPASVPPVREDVGWPLSSGEN
ncbi:hypothetical protein VTJ49DRAFT_810 [Mycothermus thermophilus]|uniref:Uncharacterized protein n=1 Tax=Humicola insolens TaxID=85995 RepID=A0ABR3VDX7_HUMIN